MGNQSFWGKSNCASSPNTNVNQMWIQIETMLGNWNKSKKPTVCWKLFNILKEKTFQFINSEWNIMLQEVVGKSSTKSNCGWRQWRAPSVKLLKEHFCWPRKTLNFFPKWKNIVCFILVLIHTKDFRAEINELGIYTLHMHMHDRVVWF